MKNNTYLRYRKRVVSNSLSFQSLILLLRVTGNLKLSSIVTKKSLGLTLKKIIIPEFVKVNVCACYLHLLLTLLSLITFLSSAWAATTLAHANHASWKVKQLTDNSSQTSGQTTAQYTLSVTATSTVSSLTITKPLPRGLFPSWTSGATWVCL